MTYERSIEEVAETLRNAKARGRGCTLLIGAGCSAKAGIPTAAGLIRVIEERYPRAFQRADKKTYPTCMSELLLSERRDVAAAKRFFYNAIRHHGMPRDHSGRLCRFASGHPGTEIRG